MILKVQDLKKHFPIKDKQKNLLLKAVDGVSFEMEEGKTFGLVGESGCGKSTTAKMIIKLLEPTSGSILINGTDLVPLKAKEMHPFRKNIQMVFQDPYASLNPRMTIERTIMDPLKIHGIGTPAEQKKRVAELLELVGLDKRYANRYPHEFSGGQRQRIGIARALALNPKIVILDEPVSALDVSVQSQILNLLKQLQKELKLTYLFISHNLAVVEYMCDTVAVMYLGKIAEYADKSSLFNNPKHPYTKALLSAVPVPEPNSKKERIIIDGDIPSPSSVQKGCLFAGRCPEVLEICKEKEPAEFEVREGHKVFCHKCGNLNV
ncbi:MAG: ABC transporter ATP-binding protein [Caulobacteraceae bacterium]